MALYRIEGWNDQKAQEVGDVLNRLGNKFTPYDVVETARSERSPLHSYFEWDDSRAADEYRVQQARSLIQKVRIVVVNRNQEKVETRAFHNVEVVVENKMEHRYVPLSVVKQDKRLADQVIREALSELKDWDRKYHQYSDILGVEIFDAIETTLQHSRHVIRLKENIQAAG